MGMTASLTRLNVEQWQELKDNPELVLEEFWEREGLMSVDLDKAWHAIHYVLNGQAWEGVGPLAQTILGGERLEVNEDAVNVALLSPADVQLVNQALQAISHQDFIARYDAKALDKAEVYPQIWVRDGQDGLNYVLEYFSELKAGYEAAAASGEGLLISVG
jgi:hypothetical protein